MMTSRTASQMQIESLNCQSIASNTKLNLTYFDVFSDINEI